MVSLKQLRAFAMLAEELHFGRAAERLNITQPPLSLAIKELESQWGAQLFNRTKRTVVLSALGEHLLAQVNDLLASVDRLELSARAAARGEVGALSLAFVSIVDYSFLPALLRAFTEKYPGVRVQLREATTDVQFELLAGDQIDVGIVLGNAESIGDVPSRLSYKRLKSESLVLALPSNHQLIKGSKPIALAECARESFITIPRRVSPQLRSTLELLCRDAGFVPRVVQEAIQMQTIISLVSAGLGIALVPESICSLGREGVSYRRLTRASKRAPVAPLDIGLVWRANDKSAVLQRFISIASRVRGEGIVSASR